MAMRKTLMAALSATLIAGTFGGVALARQHGEHALPPMARPGVFVFMLKNFDANRDGKVTAEEAKAGADTLFAKIDTDKDGSITPKEMRTWHESRMQAMKDAMKPKAGADKAQSNDDGAMDDMDGPDGGKPDGDHMGKHHGRGPHMMGRGMMRMLDTDENGQINRAEAEAGAANLMKQMDTNGDGVVSIDDFPG
nr:EF-hand domain-containing protein [uncultured Gellertiella sp.]